MTAGSHILLQQTSQGSFRLLEIEKNSLMKFQLFFNLKRIYDSVGKALRNYQQPRSVDCQLAYSLKTFLSNLNASDSTNGIFFLLDNSINFPKARAVWQTVKHCD